MNKSELVDCMVDHCDLTKNDCEKAVSAFIKAIQESLKNGEDVTLVGFGSFCVKRTSERSARNFKTGEAIKVPAKNTVRFKQGKTLKEFIN